MDSLETRLRALVLLSLEGDRAAYRQLLGELTHYLRIYFARRLAPAHAANVEDLVQETLLAVHAKRLTYDTARPFTAWLHALAHHKLVDHLRRHAIRPTVPLDDEMTGGVPAGDLAAHDLDRVLETLPERTSTLIRRVKVEGASVAEAASAHGMSEGAAKIAIHRGLKALMARFAGDR
ncbi:sigma-70 family RNA polymerase sigma factor [Pelagibacterium halotolerans]|uniref:RNA polymerase sigma-70 factor, ECF subfamily n=1 Tax=Pelagibacterium halotolerans (strain DSM 22347 / JCM 15775 / CGMCC 1.7692 / B2) TaxID=1082931 RepID=G4R7F8_PELHB|nr:sigma-70 family RNA polymerase sigma factor [Pelagibacterium halotolerans]AEQ52259.1 RNA polymerase sigma-70 factor, ECF subfamily [Pelagibacterium halotolerans B2]QJR17991.1 sigma-70 family RNA polymerase sigma factor [Pelagibacterium halotolerans]